MANYEDFVDGVGHLTEAWKDIQENPNSEGAKYWKNRMDAIKALPTVIFYS